jgi:hypothetical protein
MIPMLWIPTFQTPILSYLVRFFFSLFYHYIFILFPRFFLFLWFQFSCSKQALSKGHEVFFVRILMKDLPPQGTNNAAWPCSYVNVTSSSETTNSLNVKKKVSKLQCDSTCTRPQIFYSYRGHCLGKAERGPLSSDKNIRVAFAARLLPLQSDKKRTSFSIPSRTPRH